MIKQHPRGIPYTDEKGNLVERALQQNRLLVELDILEGSGSPEGVIEAKTRRIYMDTAGTAGNILYIKRDADIAGDRTTGWILI